MSSMEPGCVVRVMYGEETIEGTFITKIPHFTIKLESGYNLVLEEHLIKEITEVHAKKTEKILHATVQGKGKKIAILHLGGTVASKIDYTTGAVIAQSSPEEIIRLYPELTHICDISSRLIRNMQSEMMRFCHYNIIAEAIIEEVKKGVQGIIITHGTDELHYTSAALAFMFEELSIPIILTASQRSSDRPSSDARQNLISAALFATTAKPGVYICMHENMNDDSCIIISGIRARKFHTTRRDAFKPINGTPLARVNPEKKTIEILRQETALNTGHTCSYKKFNDHLKIAVIKGRPNMHAEELLFYNDYDGIVLEGLGLGHMPTEKIDEFTSENKAIYAALKKLAEKTPVVFASQCIFGRVNFNVYTPGRELLSAGILGNQLDIPPETAYIKLAYLLSNYKKDDVKRLYQENLRGEISERISGEDFL
jgi:glutamyl-tRNA(Gln) amidotransferase subunit D